jgi:hypothetical protein
MLVGLPMDSGSKSVLPEAGAERSEVMVMQQSCQSLDAYTSHPVGEVHAFFLKSPTPSPFSIDNRCLCHYSVPAPIRQAMSAGVTID